MKWAGVLIQLGHAEFDPKKRTVSACAPGLVVTNDGRKAILYGYWDLRLRTELGKIEANPAANSPKKGPTRWTIEASPPIIEAVSQWNSVWVSEDVSVHLLQRLPVFSVVLNDLEHNQRSSSGNWERFEYLSNLWWRWRTTKNPLSEPGLYRCRDGRCTYVFVQDDHTQSQLKTQDQKLAARWACYNQTFTERFDWFFDPERRELLIPYATPELPILVSRALTMSSARLPTQIKYEKRQYRRYRCVAEPQAIEAARIMNQQLTTRSLSNV